MNLNTGECTNSEHINIFPAKDQFQCLQLCKANQECNWFSFYPTVNTCQLLNSCDTLNQTICSDCLSGQVSISPTAFYVKKASLFNSIKLFSILMKWSWLLNICWNLLQVDCSAPPPTCWLNGHCQGNISHVEVPVTSEDNCLKICQDSPTCHWFTYVEDQVTLST